MNGNDDRDREAKPLDSQAPMIERMDAQYPVGGDWFRERVGFLRGWEAAIKWVKEENGQ